MKASNVIGKRDEYYAYGSVLEAISQGLYPNRKHILREFIQNAYDALSDLHHLQPTSPLAAVEITARAPSLIIADKGIGMSQETMRRYRYLGFSDKQTGTHAGFRGIGKFSAISVCDRLIVRSSKLGDAKSYQVEIDAGGMWKALKKDKNPPLESLLRDYSTIAETDEKPEEHYTFVELHGIHKDATELLDDKAIQPYLMRVAPVPFNPSFIYGKEIIERLHQVSPHFLEISVLLNGQPIHKPFLDNCKRPDYREIFQDGKSGELLAFAWFCQNLGKGQFRQLPAGKDQPSRRDPNSGMNYRVSNFAVGDSTLARKTLWHTTPERAFYFFGEIHVLDNQVIPTSDRDDFEDSTARGRLYERCREISTVLNYRAGQESQQRRFVEILCRANELMRPDLVKRG